MCEKLARSESLLMMLMTYMYGVVRYFKSLIFIHS